MRYYVERIGQALITIFLVVNISFGLTRLIPGGPMDYLRAQLSSQAQQGGGGRSAQNINQLMEAYTNINPEEPIWNQYISYMSSVLTGDFGISVWYGTPVVEKLGAALPWTLLLMSASLFLSFLIGIGMGSLMAYSEGSAFDSGFSVLATVLTSIPFYIVALLLLYVFAYKYQIFPDGGQTSSAVTPGLNAPFLVDVVYHAILPVLSIVLTAWGTTALAMRGNSIQVLKNDYMYVGRLRGLSERRLAFRYVARNAILPMYTGLLISVGFMFGGSVILEEIFGYPGVGYYLLRAVQARDYTLMMGAFILITVSVVIAMVFADLTYGKLDPRARTTGGSDR